MPEMRMSRTGKSSASEELNAGSSSPLLEPPAAAASAAASDCKATHKREKIRLLVATGHDLKCFRPPELVLLVRKEACVLPFAAEAASVEPLQRA